MTDTSFKIEVGKTYQTNEATPRRVRVVDRFISVTGNERFVGMTQSALHPDRESALTYLENGSWFGDRGRKLQPIPPPVVKKLYTNVVENIEEGILRGMLVITGNYSQPQEYMSNYAWEHRAILEIIITDSEVTSVNIIK